MRVLKGLLVGILATGLVACDRGTIDSNLLSVDESGNNNIYRTYRVDYNEENSQSMASATFSVGGSRGTTVKLIEPASLRINGGNAEEKTDVMDGGEVGAFYAGFLFPPAWLLMGASGTNYHKAISRDSSQVSFEFIDNAGTRFYEQASIPSLYLSLPESISASGFSLSVSGDTHDGRLSVRLSQGDSYASSSSRGSTVEVSASDLEGFSYGPVEVQVEWTKYDKIESDKNSLGGKVIMSYSFSKRQIQFR